MNSSRLYEYFSPEELSCRCGCGLGQHDMNPDFMRKIVAIRRETGIVMPVSSAVRCWNHNRMVSNTRTNPPHVMKTFSLQEGPSCHAIDIRIGGTDAYRIIEALFDLNLGITGIGLSQDGPFNKRFIHLDDLPAMTGCPRPWIWSYYETDNGDQNQIFRIKSLRI